MSSFKDFEPSVQCDECDEHFLIGDNSNNPILETCDDCIEEQKLFENMSIEHKLDEVIQWITNDCWHELSQRSKKRIIRQLRFMGYSIDDLKEVA